VADLDADDREKIPTKEFGLPEKARTKEAKKQSGNYPCRTRRMLAMPRHALLRRKGPATCPRRIRNASIAKRTRSSTISPVRAGPDTTLDSRFSDSNAVATDWEETRRVLDNADLFWISTVRADGRPHVTPLVAVWLDDAIHFATGPSEQKALNLRTNPSVALTTGCNQRAQGLDVVLEREGRPSLTLAQPSARLTRSCLLLGLG